MKRKALLQTAFTLTAMLLLAAACTQDEFSDGSQGEPLPEGTYPLTFTAAVDGLTATRATTGNSWEGNEEVAVQIGSDVKKSDVKKYTAATDGKLSAATGVNPFYWQSTTEEKTVSAWYPYSATKPATFSVQADQSGTNQSGTNQSGTDGYQGSDLIYAASQKVAYSGNRKLTFKHLPVKVVVNLKAGDGVTADEITNATVSIVKQALQSGAITEGTTSPDATIGGATTAVWSVAQVTSGDAAIIPNVLTTAATDYQKSVQALLVPQQMKDKQFIKVAAGGNDYYYTPTNETDANLKAGQQYTYYIKVSKNGLTVTASGAAAWTGTEKDATNKVPKTGFAAADLKIGDYYYSDGTTSDGGYRKYTDGSTGLLGVAPASGKTCIGVVYCTDKSFITNNSTKKTSYTNGLVVALKDASTSSSWDNAGSAASNYGNTVAAPSGSSSGWYVPNKEELMYICRGSNYNNKSGIGRDMLNAQFGKLGSANATNFTSAYYWSSTEYSYASTHAFYVDFDNGDVSNYNKYLCYRVRCVFAF